MKQLSQTTQFRRDLKRETKTHRAINQLLAPVLEALVAGEDLPAKLRDHILIGENLGCRECHLRPDLLLIYLPSEAEIKLVRLESHSELFG